MPASARPAMPLLVFCSIVFSFSDLASAQLRLPFQRRSAASSETADASATSAVLTESAGPWLIMCASYSGQDGRRDAEQLADELRSEHGLKAYIYQHQFNVEDELTSRGFRQAVIRRGGDEFGSTKLKLASGGDVQEYAVLVGDFPAIDDGRAQQVLATVKSHQPRVNVSTADAMRQDVAAVGDRVRAFRDASHGADDSAGEQDPLRLAFLMPNPLLPDAYFNREIVDDFVLKMNKRTKYSLLSNPGAYTVKVATFTGGKKMLNDSVSEKLRALNGNSLFKKSNKASDLETALVKAAVLARYLRKYEKLEAYQFHDRNSSYVCVGSFDWMTRQGAGGTETNPDVKAILDKFTGSVQKVTNNGIQAKSFPLPDKLADARIVCSATPEVIAVPKAKATSVASRLMEKLR